LWAQKAREFLDLNGKSNWLEFSSSLSNHPLTDEVCMMVGAVHNSGDVSSDFSGGGQHPLACKTTGEWTCQHSLLTAQHLINFMLMIVISPRLTLLVTQVVAVLQPTHQSWQQALISTTVTMMWSQFCVPHVTRAQVSHRGNMV
jgi:hypothetical protein